MQHLTHNVDFPFLTERKLNLRYVVSRLERREKRGVDKPEETIEGEIYPMSHNLDLMKIHQQIT